MRIRYEPAALTVSLSNGVARYKIEQYDYSDRPQYIAQSITNEIYYSTKPTSTAPDGTIRHYDPNYPNPDVRMIWQYATRGGAENVAVIKEVLPGKLKFKRAQGSGPLREYRDVTPLGCGGSRPCEGLREPGVASIDRSSRRSPAARRSTPELWTMSPINSRRLLRPLVNWTSR